VEPAHGNLEEHLEVPEEARQGALLGAPLSLGEILVVERDLAHGLDIVTAFVPAHRDVEGEEGIDETGHGLKRERPGQDGNRSRESLSAGALHYAQDVVREKKGGVDRHEDVVGDHPALFQEAARARRDGPQVARVG
jgi:hypothetical protein